MEQLNSIKYILYINRTVVKQRAITELCLDFSFSLKSKPISKLSFGRPMINIMEGNYPPPPPLTTYISTWGYS